MGHHGSPDHPQQQLKTKRAIAEVKQMQRWQFLCQTYPERFSATACLSSAGQPSKDSCAQSQMRKMTTA
eukprot:1156888-Pelagomonas_calceolata.AAC.5